MILFVFLASTVLGDCVLQERKVCTGGTRMKLNKFNRDNNNDDAKHGTCLAQCAYYGIDGCCQLDVDSGNCYFSKDGKLKTDNTQKKVMVSEYGEYPMRFEYKSMRNAGMCSWSGHLTMVKYERTNQCDWNGEDKRGQKQRSGTSTKTQCIDFCFNDANCVFSSFKNGQCRSFQTCNTYGAYFNNGYEVWQKVDQDAPYDPADNRWAGQRCDDGCMKYASEWIGDGVCDHDSCATCSGGWTKNGVFDGGDCGKSSAWASIAYASTSSSTISPAVYVLAAVGFGFTIYGSFRFYTK